MVLRGADDAYVDRTTLLPPERHARSRSSIHVQEARLQRHRHVADLVEEQGAAVGLQDAADAASRAARR